MGSENQSNTGSTSCHYDMSICEPNPDRFSIYNRVSSYSVRSNVAYVTHSSIGLDQLTTESGPWLTVEQKADAVFYETVTGCPSKEFQFQLVVFRVLAVALVMSILSLGYIRGGSRWLIGDIAISIFSDLLLVVQEPKWGPGNV